MVNNELQRYYELRFDMFASQGWKDLMDDVERMLQSTNDISSIIDEKTLHFKRGEISMMRWMLSLQEVSEQTYKQLNEDDETVD